ncbi:cyclin-dependent kinase 4 [Diretmus argenteus]
MEVNGAAQRYEILAEVGEGAFAKVYKARETGEQQRLVALKEINIHCDPDNGIPPFTIRELELLRQMMHFNHPNIVQLLDASAILNGSDTDLTLVFEYIDQDLSVYLAKAPPSGLGGDKIKDVMMQLLQGLDFLHINMVVHRDLKPENILVSSHGKVKIADFELAHIFTLNIALTPGVVTLWYRAPEVLLNSAELEDMLHMSSVDMWSAGCIFAELFLLKPLFHGSTEAQQLQNIFEAIGLPSQEDWPNNSPVSYAATWAPEGPGTQLLPNLGQVENNLLSQCLEFRPTHRISAAEALAHPFFTTD